MPDAGHGVDGRGHRPDVSATVVEGGPGRGGGQLDGRHRPVLGVVDALGGLPNADDDGRTRVEIHSLTIYRGTVSGPKPGVRQRHLGQRDDAENLRETGDLLSRIAIRSLVAPTHQSRPVWEVQMSYVIAAPEYLAAAASDLANIGSSLSAANSVAMAPTSGVLAAGADEVSAMIAALFSTHAQAYQALSALAASFHAQFVQLMNGGASEYALTEAANASPLQTVGQSLLSAVNMPSEAALGTGANTQPGGILISNSGAGTGRARHQWRRRRQRRGRWAFRRRRRRRQRRHWHLRAR